MQAAVSWDKQAAVQELETLAAQAGTDKKFHCHHSFSQLGLTNVWHISSKASLVIQGCSQLECSGLLINNGTGHVQSCHTAAWESLGMQGFINSYCCFHSRLIQECKSFWKSLYFCWDSSVDALVVVEDTAYAVMPSVLSHEVKMPDMTAQFAQLRKLWLSETNSVELPARSFQQAMDACTVCCMHWQPQQCKSDWHRLHEGQSDSNLSQCVLMLKGVFTTSMLLASRKKVQMTLGCTWFM